MPFVNGIWQEDETDDVETTPTDPTEPEEPNDPSDPTPDQPEVTVPEYKPITNSIMLTVKKMLGIAEEYHAFDLDIITNINACFLTLNQLGVGPRYPFSISGPETQWNDFLEEQSAVLQGIQTYVYMRVRLMFDPPTNSFLVDSLKKQIDEMEWRFMTQVDYHTYRDGKLEGEFMIEMSPERVKEIYEKAKAGDQEAIAMLTDLTKPVKRNKKHFNHRTRQLKDIFR